MSPVNPSAKRGKAIIPHRPAVIIAYRCLEVLISFREIHTVISVSKSTASDT
ncbi:hypothetical protein L873DRAFT_1732468 [Choiromyces venosus 120613-1]|uniref:Uncharacterized protein n=1 Tax=Choiromyces venosus 120613-1 TaxID=1336337 RepID=A0A3N4K080_9PEZI|nr:hypothetical protein L873DRAFT_1732468 [Choiromyces venosus 120613-1]